MEATRAGEPIIAEHGATVERTSDRDLVVTGMVHGPAHLVFEAWTNADLLRQWWVPKSFPITLVSCETDPRVGGTYRMVFGHEGSTMEFFGRYLDVTPPSRLAWTNDEGDEGGAVTTVTFEERDGGTLVVLHDRYPSAEALEEGSGSTNAMPEVLQQLDELLQGTGRPA